MEQHVVTVKPFAAFTLKRPIMVVALEGWFDVARTATGAVAAIAAHGSAETACRIEAEFFVDLQAHRPHISIDDGEISELLWPDTTIEVVTSSRRDLVLASGIEPDYQWKTYVNALLDQAVDAGAEMVVTLGAALAMVSHTAPVMVNTSASSPSVARQLGLPLPTYQGITGIVGVLQEQLAARSIPGVSLRVPVPHYLNPIGFPAGQRALLDRISALAGLPAVPIEDDGWEERLSDLLDDNDELEAHIAMLDHQRADQPEIHDPNLLIAEIERYLGTDE
jgi:predicted ATP-grasp superfamily ATP-dependent carboligase